MKPGRIQFINTVKAMERHLCIENWAYDLKSIIAYSISYRKRINYDKRNNPHAKIADLLNTNGCGLDVLLFGDSVAERTSYQDRDARPLFRIIKDMLACDTNYYHITHSAYCVDMYYLYLALILSLNIRPRVVIMPINLRSFSPQWDCNPMFQNIYHSDMLLSMLNQGEHLQVDLRNYRGETSIRRFYGTTVVYRGSGLNRIRHFQRIIVSKPKTDSGKAERKRNIFIYHYMNEVCNNHRKFNPLSNIVALCEQCNVPLVLYFTPINYEAGRRYLGESFNSNVNSNIKVIIDLVTSITRNKSLIHVYDFSAALTSGYFFNKDDATEHLCDLGRRELAGKLLDTIVAARNADVIFES